MTSSSMPEQEHRRSLPETVTMASDDPQPQMPGLLDPTAGRSDAATMVTGGAGDEEEVVTRAEGPLGDVVLIDSPWGVLLAPTPLSIMKQDEVRAPPHPYAAPSSTKQCVQCGATETTQWRFQPMGQGLICNACRIRLRPAEALREPVHVHVHLLPPPATATTTVVSKSPADAWISDAWMEFDAYLLKVTSPRREKSPSPAPAPAPEEKKQKRKRNPWYPPKSSKRCHHCNSASTPEWRTGPAGPGTLCNACGVRYGQGRLLPEYRPAASPNFKASEHSCKHQKVLKLRHKKKKKHRGKKQHQPPELGAGDGMEQHLPPPPAQARAGGDELPTGEPNPLDQLLLDAIDGSPETTHIMYGDGGELQMGDPSSLDQFLFDGPAAPLLIDDDDEEEDLAD